jgi:hypothetical protein
MLRYAPQGWVLLSYEPSCEIRSAETFQLLYRIFSLNPCCVLFLFQVGGRNTVLVDALTRRIPLVSDIPTIIFGADVTHPHPGEDSSPSIAAVS